MKKLFLLLACCFFLSGCWIYGEGKSVGYVTTVEDGIFWNTIHFRADYTSSNTDAYVVSKSNVELSKRLLETSLKKQRIEIVFKKHVIVASQALFDEVVDFILVN